MSFHSHKCTFLKFQKSGSNIQKGLEDNSETIDWYGYWLSVVYISPNLLHYQCDCPAFKVVTIWKSDLFVCWITWLSWQKIPPVCLFGSIVYSGVQSSYTLTCLCTLIRQSKYLSVRKGKLISWFCESEFWKTSLFTGYVIKCALLFKFCYQHFVVVRKLYVSG